MLFSPSIYIRGVRDSESEGVSSTQCLNEDIFDAEKVVHCCPRGTFAFRIDLRYKSPSYY